MFQAEHPDHKLPSWELARSTCGDGSNLYMCLEWESTWRMYLVIEKVFVVLHKMGAQILERCFLGFSCSSRRFILYPKSVRPIS